MIERLHATARQADPVRPLVLNGLQWDSINGLLALDVRPFRNSNVLYAFHYYDPHAFTHQGVNGDTQWIVGLTWPWDEDNATSVLAEALSRIDNDPKLSSLARAQARLDTKNYFAALSRTRPGHAQVERDFKTVSLWATERGIAPDRIILGEFGCVFSSGSTPLGADRLHWLRTVRLASEQAQFSWAYWAYKGHGGMELVGPNGLLDPDTLQALGGSIPR
jgi:hypothetical protein